MLGDQEGKGQYTTPSGAFAPMQGWHYLTPPPPPHRSTFVNNINAPNSNPTHQGQSYHRNPQCTTPCIGTHVALVIMVWINQSPPKSEIYSTQCAHRTLLWVTCTTTYRPHPPHNHGK